MNEIKTMNMSKHFWWFLPSAIKIVMYENRPDMKYEQIVADETTNDETDDDAADDTPIDDDADEAPDDEDCNEVCLCSASVLSTKIKNICIQFNNYENDLIFNSKQIEA